MEKTKKSKRKSKKNSREIDELETEIKKTDLKIETIECASSKLISDLNMGKWLGMKRIKKLK